MTHDRFPREPLTPDEQALAHRLGQLGPHGEPSPALDARILAAARGARASSRRPVRRWPVALGVAASLVLAVGIAWRLRPPPGPAADDGMTRAMTVPQAPVADQAGAARNAEGEADQTAPAPSPAGEAAAARVAREPAVDEAPADTAKAPTQAVARSAPAPLPAPPAPEPAVVLDAPAASAPAIAALPAPPPPSPPSEAGALPPRANAAPAPLARKAASPATQEQDAGFDAAAAANAAEGDEPSDDVPPATADSPAVRDAWLQRIRELFASGQADAARASLKEFVHRHPDAPLPDDLRALAK